MQAWVQADVQELDERVGQGLIDLIEVEVGGVVEHLREFLGGRQSAAVLRWGGSAPVDAYCSRGSVVRSVKHLLELDGESQESP